MDGGKRTGSCRVSLRLDNGSIITVKPGANKTVVMVSFEEAIRQGRGGDEHVQKMQQLLEVLKNSQQQNTAPIANGVHSKRPDPTKPASPKRARTQLEQSVGTIARGPGADWTSTCRKFISRMRRILGKHLKIFDEAVDRSRYPDYYDMIKNPIWLKKIESNLESGVYREPLDFHRDVLLMWSNCAQFNPPGDWVRKLGDDTRQTYLQLWKQSKLVPESVTAAGMPSVLSEGAGSDLASNRSKRRIKPKLPFEPEDVRRQSSVKKSGKSQVATSSLSTDERIKELYKVLSSLEEADMAKVYELVNTDPAFLKHIEENQSRDGETVELQLELLGIQTICKLEDLVRTQFRAQLPRYPGKARRSSSRSTQNKQQQQQQQEMSAQRKEKLMKALEQLIMSNDNHQAEVLKIVKETNALDQSQAGDDDNGYELDFAALDSNTLWALDRYVQSQLGDAAWAEYDGAGDSSGNSSTDSDSGSDSE